ncbi:MAG: 30S ribosomal protein S6 [Solirubrobacterales bacterium]|nr:30S ribosomal protein S6 [Solirubrobacterales bacterium]
MPENPTYDLMLLLDTAAPDEQRSKVLDEVERILSTNGATVVGKHDWGSRKMAFEIRHKNDADYHLLQFQGSPEVPAALDRYLRLSDGVVRFRVIKLRPATPAPPDLRAAATEQAAPEPESAPVERV